MKPTKEILINIDIKAYFVNLEATLDKTFNMECKKEYSQLKENFRVLYELFDLRVVLVDSINRPVKLLNIELEDDLKKIGSSRILLTILRGSYLRGFPYEKPIEDSESFITEIAGLYYLEKFAKHIKKLEQKELTQQIKEKTTIKPLKWNSPSIEFITLMYDLLEIGLITGNKESVAELIQNNFVNEKGQPFKKSYILKILTPEKDKSKKRADLSDWC